MFKRALPDYECNTSLTVWGIYLGVCILGITQNPFTEILLKST